MSKTKAKCAATPTERSMGYLGYLEAEELLVAECKEASKAAMNDDAVQKPIYQLRAREGQRRRQFCVGRGREQEGKRQDVDANGS